MKTPTNLRTDTSIENVIFMLTPILEECDLIGPAIPMTEVAQLCRNRRSRLPLRGYNGVRMAEELAFLSNGGSLTIGNLDVQLRTELDLSSRRSRYHITVSRINDPEIAASVDALLTETKPEEKGANTIA